MAPPALGSREEGEAGWEPSYNLSARSSSSTSQQGGTLRRGQGCPGENGGGGDGHPLTAAPSPLPKAVNEQSSIVLPDTVSAIMDRWTLQMGFPVITVDTNTGTISQKHFLLDHNSNVTHPSEFK